MLVYKNSKNQIFTYVHVYINYLLLQMTFQNKELFKTCSIKKLIDTHY